VNVADITGKDHAIILFDGVCNFCCASVQFIIARDPQGYFQFASQQSDLGQAMLAAAHLPATLETFVLVEGSTVSTRSTAALKVTSRLTQPWPLCAVFWLVPRFLRDVVYRWIAKNRYRWFGQKETCWLPTPEIRARFLS
jgi:predicted DCC family thiol-disulfide oxidoreductase YuxK